MNIIISHLSCACQTSCEAGGETLVSFFLRCETLVSFYSVALQITLLRGHFQLMFVRWKYLAVAIKSVKFMFSSLVLSSSASRLLEREPNLQLVRGLPTRVGLIISSIQISKLTLISFIFRIKAANELTLSQLGLTKPSSWKFKLSEIEFVKYFKLKNLV
jgi:hypothetical protein